MRLFLQEKNVHVIMVAVRVVGLLAQTMRTRFKAQAKLLLPHLLDRLADKKASLVEQTQSTL